MFSSVDRQKGRLAGFSLYVSNTDVKSPDGIKKSLLCYKDGPGLPPLNLTKKCIGYGRYIIFYNERLDGIVYPKEYEVANVFTELCEVTIQGKQNQAFLPKIHICDNNVIWNAFSKKKISE